MTKVEAEGTVFFYFDSKSSLDYFSIVSPKDIEIYLAKGSDTRLSLFGDMLQRGKLVPYWLVWQKRVNLIQIDQEVLSGCINESIFIDCFRTILLTSRCRNCDSKFLSLGIDAGDPYPGNLELSREKILKLDIIRCPKCDSSFGQLLAKIICELN
jgi:hypothetical protein